MSCGKSQREIDFVRSVACGVDPELKPRWRYTVLNAFVDDSGSDLQGPAYLLTGYSSDVESWVGFSREWKDALVAPPSISYFKMREAESGKGQFEGWENSVISAKIHTLIPIINRYTKYRIECIFWQDHYDVAMTWFLSQIRKQLAPLDFAKVQRTFEDPYFLAFCLIMTDYSQRLEMEGSDEIIDFIFDTQGAIGKNAVKWWRRLNEIFPTIYYQKHLPNEPIHRDDKIFLPLQAADLLAWQTRRRLEDFNIHKIEAKRPEYEMLEAVQLYPNRWNETRLRDFFGKLLVPVPGESGFSLLG